MQSNISSSTRCKEPCSSAPPSFLGAKIVSSWLGRPDKSRPKLRDEIAADRPELFRQKLQAKRRVGCNVTPETAHCESPKKRSAKGSELVTS